MATTDTAKSSGSKAKSGARSRSTANKTADAKRSASQRGRANGSRRSAGGRRGYQMPNMPDMPAWATTLASVVGVGVAVGIGLFATRKQWLPQAEEWGEQLQERFGRSHDDADDDDYYIDDEAEDWESAKPATAKFPGRNAGATAAGAV